MKAIESIIDRVILGISPILLGARAIDERKMNLRHDIAIDDITNILDIALRVAKARGYNEPITKSSQVYKDTVRIATLPQESQIAEVLKIEVIGKTKEEIDQKLSNARLNRLKIFNSNEKSAQITQEIAFLQDTLSFIEARSIHTINATHFNDLKSFSKQADVIKSQNVLDTRYKSYSLNELQSTKLQLQAASSLTTNDLTKYSYEIIDLQQKIDSKKIEASKTLTQEQRTKMIKLYEGSNVEALKQLQQAFVETLQQNISKLRQNQDALLPRDVNLEITINQGLAKSELLKQIIKNKSYSLNLSSSAPSQSSRLGQLYPSNDPKPQISQVENLKNRQQHQNNRPRTKM
jgi:hypothetical protein